MVVIRLQEKKVNEIVLKAMGQAISKTVAIAEIIKVQITAILCFYHDLGGVWMLLLSDQFI